jgi:hypothetical protein
VEALDLAKRIILKCLRIYDRPDYEPNIVASYGGPKPFPFPGARIQGVSMLLIRTISQMLEMRPDEELEKIISHCVEVVLHAHYNPEFSQEQVDFLHRCAAISQACRGGLGRGLWGNLPQPE